ncbi:hypothetical protein IWZ03DRAFT_355968 [Phyllosticta citriasiana]|uniref:C2H2 type master regulator of conidiophore development brlA n=1 Tax=Phyllosticta citriasiana TaxID=595635 RepID=A0ABR1KY64_9PEZI
MPSLLLALLLLALFADAVQASSDFPFDPFTLDSSAGPPYGDPDGLLSLCTICGLDVLMCTHGIQRALPSSGIRSVLRAADFLEHPEWPRDAMQLAPSTTQSPQQAEPIPYPASMASISRYSGQMSGIDDDAVVAWNADTYNPGFGFEPEETRVAPLAKKQRLRRNTNGFPCSFSDCDSVFDRQCDLDRHFRTSHTSASDRPHKCTYGHCDASFVYPKDLRRHESTHSKASRKHPCPVDSCEWAFSRKDNLQRHMKNKHSGNIS